MAGETHTSKKIRREMTYREVRNLLDGQPLVEIKDHPNERTQAQFDTTRLSGKQVVPNQVKIRPAKRKQVTFPTDEHGSQADTLDHHIKVTEVSDTYEYQKIGRKTRANSNDKQTRSQPAPSTVQHAVASQQQKPVEKVKTQDIGDEALRNQSKMLRGSLWMTVGNLVSRLLGALYIIPWSMMLGVAYTTAANGLYAQGYQIYSVALLIATAGLPNALARLVAEFAAKKQFGYVKDVLRQSLLLGGVMGIIAGAALYALAGPLSQGNPNVIPVIRSLAAGVLIIPVLSMLRGYVQGLEMMGLSALSQVVEQIVRVAYMLALTAWIMLGQHGDWVDATVQSTLAAFWGALAGVVVLLLGMLSRRHYLKGRFIVNENSGDPKRSFIGMMARQSIPVIYAGSAISLVQVIDQFTFFKIMHMVSNVNQDMLDQMFAQFAFNSNKLVMLVVSLAVAMSETTLPLLSRARAIGTPTTIADQITYIFKLLALVMVPASLGMAAVARPLYILFYGMSDVDNGVLMLELSSFVGLTFGVYMVVLAIYQGLGRLRLTSHLMTLILLSKLILQYPAVALFGGMGPLISTGIAFLIGLSWILWHLKREYPLNMASFNYSLMVILFWGLIMFGVISPLTRLLELQVSTSRLAQLGVLVIMVFLGGLIYGWAILKSHVGPEVFGDRARRIRRKLSWRH
ncbi:oligosaccharide flippase family protein [Weissella kandleri]|uniref:putative polysaccharide biosynthesis protein n=1 Tax=Weissella kandleri TaxID=1616 RepID=UPI00387ECC26